MLMNTPGIQMARRNLKQYYKILLNFKDQQ